MRQLVYPWSCVVCARLCQVETGVCKQCYPLLPWCQSTCTQCGAFVPANNINRLLCGSCHTKRPFFDRLYAAFWYRPPINQLMVGFKYSQRWENLRLLVHLFSTNHPEISEDTLLLPVPSHPQRIRSRGFNAVVELTRLLKVNRYVNCDTSYIRRIFPTHTQTGMSKRQRRTNVSNAFKIVKPITHSKVILFDDVVTTCATVNEISRCLKREGVKNIEVWTIARTENS